MATSVIDWGAYDLKERTFELAMAEGKAQLAEHPLPSGGVLAEATDEQVELAARQFKQRGHSLLVLADWLRTRRTTPLKTEATSLKCANG
jgi:hypothetical protein